MKDFQDNSLSIVLPVFNEEDNIEKTIQDICDYRENSKSQIEIIVVNDGSQDASLSILERMKSIIPHFKLINHLNNQGYGAALRSGIGQARCKWILLMDSDGQFHINALDKLWPLRHQYDVLLGYRQDRSDAFHRLFLGRLGNAFANFFLSKRVVDINCGFKIFKREHIQSLELFSNGGIINFEILKKLFKINPSIKYQQCSIPHYPRLKGQSTGSRIDVLGKIMMEAWKIIFNKF